MKDWYNLVADKNVIMNKHFTPGRGCEIDRVVVHINAGNLTTEGCYSVWQDREASAHYQVESSGIIGQLVWDSDTAWHAGDFDINQCSIGIEHANNTFAPDWGINDTVLDNGAHLVAAICRYYGLGRPVWGGNVFGHSDFYSTACPGAIRGRLRARYMARAQEYYDSMVSGTPQSNPVATQTEATEDLIEDLARKVLAGEYGNGETRVARLGQYYEAVQNRVNKILEVDSAPVRETFDIEAAAQAVIRGEYGDGDERRQRLGQWYGQVQNRVNQILEGRATSSTPAFDIEAAAQAVIRGEYGNGEERRQRLGTNYDAVQARVNEILS